jgi:hypothetical protein
MWMRWITTEHKEASRNGGDTCGGAFCQATVEEPREPSLRGDQSSAVSQEIRTQRSNI